MLAILNENFVCFVEELDSCLVLIEKPKALCDLRIFKLNKAVSHTFLFFFLCHWRKNTSGMSSSCRDQVFLISAKFGAHCRKDDFYIPNFEISDLRKKSFVSALKTV